MPTQYKVMDPLMQRDFCYTERLKVEEYLIKGKVSPKDFFAAERTWKQIENRFVKSAVIWVKLYSVNWH